MATTDPPPSPRRREIVVGPGETGNEAFGAILEELRELTGLSRVDAAATLGISPEYLRLIETGHRTPALGLMSRFLSAYHAIGGVMVPQMDGPPAHLIVYLRPDEPIYVEFRSRIREARGARRHGPNAIASPFAREGTELIHEYNTQLGAVVSMLTYFGPDTVRRVHAYLTGIADLE